MKEIEWPDDPAFIKWLDERLIEAREAQDKEMERQHREKGEAWLKKTTEAGEDPC
jgi:hypothetical protein